MKLTGERNRLKYKRKRKREERSKKIRTEVVDVIQISSSDGNIFSIPRYNRV